MKSSGDVVLNITKHLTIMDSLDELINGFDNEIFISCYISDNFDRINVKSDY